MRNKLQLPGGSQEDRLEGNRRKGQEIQQKFQEQEDNCFDAKYVLGEKLGEGMHASVFKCWKKNDVDRIHPYAVKFSRESDEEKRELIVKEYYITKGLDHKNVVRTVELFNNELKG